MTENEEILESLIDARVAIDAMYAEGRLTLEAKLDKTLVLTADTETKANFMQHYDDEYARVIEELNIRIANVKLMLIDQ